MEIIKYPESIDPLDKIERAIVTCPFCGHNRTETADKHRSMRDNMSSSVVYKAVFADKNGVHHMFLPYLNKYLWRQRRTLCLNCKAEWISDMYPYDMRLLGIDAFKEIGSPPSIKTAMQDS